MQGKRVQPPSILYWYYVVMPVHVGQEWTFNYLEECTTITRYSVNHYFFHKVDDFSCDNHPYYGNNMHQLLANLHDS